MKASMIFTESGPILTLTTVSSLSDPKFVAKLEEKGITRCIAFEIDPELVKERYGVHFAAIVNDGYQTDDLRVLDIEGHHVFYNFSRAEMGEPIYFGF